jgi:hypothetical protein
MFQQLAMLHVMVIFEFKGAMCGVKSVPHVDKGGIR